MYVYATCIVLTATVQVGLACDNAPKRTYTIDNPLVANAFELLQLCALPAEACCGYVLAECLPGQQQTLFMRGDTANFRQAYLQLCEQMFADLCLEACSCKLLSTTLLDRPEQRECSGGGRASEMCYPVASSNEQCTSVWSEELTKLNQPEPGVTPQHLAHRSTAPKVYAYFRMEQRYL